MQEIIANSEKPKDIVYINDCSFYAGNIYVYRYGNLRVLINYGLKFYWCDLQLSSYEGHGGSDGFDTARNAIENAIENAINNGRRVCVFKTQCELREWIMKSE